MSQAGGSLCDMGLLDDAIREHLELKRRRGADPTEVERLEREALGPVRRGPQIAGDAVFDHEDAEEAAYAEESWEGLSDEALAADRMPEFEAGEIDFEPSRSAEEGRFDTEEVATDEPVEASEPEWDRDPMSPSRPVPANPPPEHPGQDTVEYDVESEELEPRVADEDDVLEETPEFLQDTPDHDRLWFEQRPPRDFDFDG
jgi:hypothetical protein